MFERTELLLDRSVPMATTNSLPGVQPVEGAQADNYRQRIAATLKNRGIELNEKELDAVAVLMKDKESGPRPQSGIVSPSTNSPVRPGPASSAFFANRTGPSPLQKRTRPSKSAPSTIKSVGYNRKKDDFIFSGPGTAERLELSENIRKEMEATLVEREAHDFVLWGQPKDQNRMVSPRVDYSYKPPYGVSPRSVIKNSPVKEEDEEILVATTHRGWQWKKLTDVIEKTKQHGDMKYVQSGEEKEALEALARNKTHDWEKLRIVTDENGLSPSLHSPGSVAVFGSKKSNSPGSSRSQWTTKRRVNYRNGKKPYVPIYLVEESEFRDGATHERNSWATTKKQFGQSEAAEIVNIAAPKAESVYHYGSLQNRAPWITRKKQFSKNGQEELVVDSIPDNVRAPTNEEHSMKKQLGRASHQSTFRITDEVEDGFSQLQSHQKRANNSLVGGTWWTSSDYCDNVGAFPDQWKTTYAQTTESGRTLSPKNAAYAHNFPGIRPLSTLQLSHEVESPRLANKRNRKEYHQAKEWFNTIRKSDVYD